MSMSKEMGMSKGMSMSSHGGGHLYMQTHEVKNCIIHYHRSANGTAATSRSALRATIIRVHP